MFPQVVPYALLLTPSSSHIEVVSQHPKIDVEEVQKTRYIYEFDRYDHSH